MTTEPANKVTAIVESIRIARRTEESSRIHAQISFPVKGAENLLATIAGQLKQAIDVTFSELQARLPEGRDEPDAYEDEMFVNGVPSKVRRPRKSARDEGWVAHYFLVNDDTPNLCATCHRTIDDELHLRTTADSVEAQDGLSDTASALIDSIDDANPNEDLTDEQLAARERIAAKSAT